MPESSSAATAAREEDAAAPNVRRKGVGVASVLVPIIAWAVSLAGSYVLHSFTCLNYASAGSTPPLSGLRGVLIGLNIAMLVITLLAGAGGLWVLRTAADGAQPRLLRFLGFLGVVSALIFAFSIVLIGFQPLVLEVC